MGSDIYHWEMVSWDHDPARDHKESFRQGYEAGMNIAIKTAIRMKGSKKLVARLEELLKHPPK
jgi:hypothetical protein